MKHTLEQIAQADEHQLGVLMSALLNRYQLVCPDTDMNVICIEKQKNANEQLDCMIELLKNMKTF